MTTTVAEPTVVHARPAYEGANIRTWIGFKQFLSLVEQAVLQWLRDQGTSARRLYLEHGLGFEVVDCSVLLPAVLELDDDVRADVRADARADARADVRADARADVRAEGAAGRGSRLAVTLSVVRDGARVTVLRGRVTVALVRERTAPAHRPAPAGLAALEVADLGQAGTVAAPEHRRLAAGQSARSVLSADPAAFLWSWRAPYFYCHFSDRVQHSGFVRALEEVVDRFLADRGISVGRMLAERSWIPVVSRARVRLIAAAHMEETVHTVFTVTGILRGTMFDARMDCYVQRGDRLVAVATGQILHGYAIAAGPGAGGLAKLDGDMAQTLTGAQALTGAQTLTGAQAPNPAQAWTGGRP